MILYGLHRTLALAVDQERDATLAERTSKGWPATDDDVNAFLEAVDRKFFAAAARCHWWCMAQNLLRCTHCYLLTFRQRSFMKDFRVETNEHSRSFFLSWPCQREQELCGIERSWGLRK